MAGDLPRFNLDVVEQIHGDRLRAPLGRFSPRRLEAGPEEHAVREPHAGVIAAAGHAADAVDSRGDREVDGGPRVGGDLAGGVAPPEVERAGFGYGGEVGVTGGDVGEEEGGRERKLAASEGGGKRERERGGRRARGGGGGDVERA